VADAVIEAKICIRQHALARAWTPLLSLPEGRKGWPRRCAALQPHSGALVPARPGPPRHSPSGLRLLLSRLRRWHRCVLHEPGPVEVLPRRGAVMRRPGDPDRIRPGARHDRA